MARHSRGRPRRLIYAVGRISKRRLWAESKLYPPDPRGPQRPQTLGACLHQEVVCTCGRTHYRGLLPTTCACGREVIYRCPWVSCRYHLYLDVTRSGTLRIIYPEREPLELEQFCTLEVAVQPQKLTLIQVGNLFNVSPERIRQILPAALAAYVREARRLGMELPDDVRLEPKHVRRRAHRAAVLADLEEAIQAQRSELHQLELQRNQLLSRSRHRSLSGTPTSSGALVNSTHDCP